MIPLKPQIKAAPTKPYPLRRSRSQPDTRKFTINRPGHTQYYDDDDEHVYEDAEISFRARRIVSRDNVAYTQAPDGMPEEYDELY